MKYLIFFIALFGLLFSTSSWAVETAPRISDREIIESLAALKQGQKDLNSRFGDINNRFEDINNRFEDINTRLDSMQNTMIALFSASMLLIIAMMGFMIWDRKTSMRPFENLEKDLRELKQHPNVREPDGINVFNVLEILREFSKKDSRMADAMRTCLPM
jgi:predicted PurR-regulated permease PerM